MHKRNAHQIRIDPRGPYTHINPFIQIILQYKEEDVKRWFVLFPLSYDLVFLKQSIPELYEKRHTGIKVETNFG